MKAALYLRSSKDRSDVSIDAQRRELLDLANSKQLTVVEEFADAVESGKDDNRPGFQALLASLKRRDRHWDYLLALDTSRIARNQYLAHALHFECEKRNIKVLYAKVPETGSAVDLVIRSVMQAFDQLHSLMSKEKGLAGMAENVKQGFRAGGRAPMGYKLQSIDTGAIRDGAAVTKSKLVLDDNSQKVSKYLSLRAAGISRTMALKQSELGDIAHTSLIGMEWNALTYAGHTVWNVQNERLSSGGYKGGVKRRPRSEWLIQYDTHPALISTTDAEFILNALETSTRSQGRKTTGDYLLSGLMFSAAGVPWHGADGKYYRCGKGRRISKDDLEESIMGHISRDLASAEFVKSLTQHTRKTAQPVPDSDIKPLRNQVTAITAKIARLTEIAVEAESPRPWYAEIEKQEKQREQLVAQLERAEADYQSAKILLAIPESEVKKILQGFSDRMQHANRDEIKETLAALIERIELEESPHLTCRIHYRIKCGDSMASPRLSDTIPALKIVRLLRLAA